MNFMVASFSGMVAEKTNGERRNRQPHPAAAIRWPARCAATPWGLSPPAARIPFRRRLIWLAYPLAYVAYSLIRGHVVDWYPYPFLDPGPRGYTGVIQSSIGIALTAAVLVYVLTLFTGQGSLLGRLRA
jgi:hypothetical protein